MDVFVEEHCAIHFKPILVIMFGIGLDMLALYLFSGQRGKWWALAFSLLRALPAGFESWVIMIKFFGRENNFVEFMACSNLIALEVAAPTKFALITPIIEMFDEAKKIQKQRLDHDDDAQKSDAADGEKSDNNMNENDFNMESRVNEDDNLRVKEKSKQTNFLLSNSYIQSLSHKQRDLIYGLAQVSNFLCGPMWLFCLFGLIMSFVTVWPYLWIVFIGFGISSIIKKKSKSRNVDLYIDLDENENNKRNENEYTEDKIGENDIEEDKKQNAKKGGEKMNYKILEDKLLAFSFNFFFFASGCGFILYGWMGSANYFESSTYYFADRPSLAQYFSEVFSRFEALSFV